MLTTFIIVFAVIFLILIALGSFNKKTATQKPEPENVRKKDNIRVKITESVGDKIKESIVDVDTTSKNNSEYHSYNIDKRKRYEVRKHSNWLAYRYIALYYELCNCNSFYDYERISEDFENIKSQALGQVSHSNLVVAVKYCRIQNILGNCDYEITENDLRKLTNWEKLSSSDEILLQVAGRYKLYWDEVVDNYKQKAARTKRLSYLISQLSEVKNKSYIHSSSAVSQKIDELIHHFKGKATE